MRTSGCGRPGGSCGVCGADGEEALVPFLSGLDAHDLVSFHSHFQIVESNSSYFALDRKATPEATQEVIMQSIEKLLEKDSPALEM